MGFYQFSQRVGGIAELIDGRENFAPGRTGTKNFPVWPQTGDYVAWPSLANSHPRVPEKTAAVAGSAWTLRHG